MKKLFLSIIMMVLAMSLSAQVNCWDGTIAETYDGGNGTAEDPYQIATAEQLALLAQQVYIGQGDDAFYILTNDICLNGSQFTWIPIGSQYPYGDKRAFHGVFDGNNHTISQMRIMFGSYLGLFSCIEGAVIKNIRIEDASIENGSISGFIAAEAMNSSIMNCCVSGTIYNGINHVGGIVGCCLEGTNEEMVLINNCVNYANIRSLEEMDAFTGGIVGSGYFVIRNCHNYGTITSEQTAAGGIAGGATKKNTQQMSPSVIEDCFNHESGEVFAVCAGGIVGKACNALISRCGNAAPVRGNGEGHYAFVGGITAMGGRISNCFNRGEVSITTSHIQNQIGGITSAVDYPGYVRNTYNTGAVIKPEADILCGIIIGATPQITLLNNCYWFGDYNVPPIDMSNTVIPGSCSFVEGETSTTWTLNEEQYGTTDLLSALNQGAIDECLWVEDEEGINGGFPIPTHGAVSYPLIGTEWYYKILNENGSVTYQYLSMTNDTTINTEDVHILVRINTLYDKGEHIEKTHEYIYERDNKVYWWNKTLGEFTVLYDFGAEVGDEWEIKMDAESLVMHVDAVEYVEYNEKSYRKLIVVSDDENIFSGDILCGVGHVTSFFPERLMNPNKDYEVEGLRCYWQENQLILKFGDVDCDEVYVDYHNGVTEEPVAMDGYWVYPNPTNGLMVVETICTSSQPEYRITNMVGQTLMTGRLNGESRQIDVSSLPNGLYFITIANHTAKLLKQ